MDRVYIIESPSPEDLFEGRCEGKALSEALRLADTDVSYMLAPSHEMFKRALYFVIEDFFDKSDKWTAMPIIHVSAHGDVDGIHLTDDDYFGWEDFRQALAEINEKIGYVPHMHDKVSKNISRITLCFSSCDGYNGYNIHASDPCPFQFLVGPISAVSWTDSLTAYQVFYHAANHRERPLTEAVNLMNTAAGLNSVFQFYESPELDRHKEFAPTSHSSVTPNGAP